MSWIPLEIVKWLVLGQFIFIGLHWIFAIALHPILLFASKKKERKVALIKECLLKGMENPSTFRMPKSLLSIPLLVPLILEFDREKKGPSWDSLKRSIFDTLLFPRAKKLAYSRRWAQRIHAIGTFTLFPDPQEEPYLLHLLKDKTPIIQYSAVYCAAKLGTRPLTELVLEVMCTADRVLRHPFHEAFVKGNDEVFPHIEDILERDTRPIMRICCLEVLSHRMTPRAIDLAKRDLYAENKDLRITAIRALGYSSDPQVPSMLIPLLQDPLWEVRALTARSLGYLKAQASQAELAARLSDPVWWVRMNSAIALKRLGPSGMHVLETQNPEEDRNAYEIAQYVIPLEF